MNIIELYDVTDKEMLKKEHDIQQYQKDLSVNITHLSNLKINSTFFDKVFHPIRMMRIKSELKRLEIVENNFQEALNASLITYMEEETGDLEEDLINAMTYSKPKYLRKFMSQNTSIINIK